MIATNEADRCTALHSGQRCPRSTKEKGAGAGKCAMDYQRARRNKQRGLPEDAPTHSARLNDPVQVAFRCPRALKVAITDKATAEGLDPSEAWREAGEAWLSRPK